MIHHRSQHNGKKSNEGCQKEGIRLRYCQNRACFMPQNLFLFYLFVTHVSPPGSRKSVLRNEKHIGIVSRYLNELRGVTRPAFRLAFSSSLALSTGGGGGPKGPPPRKRCLPCLHGRTASGSDSILTNLWIFQRFLRKCDISDIIFRFR